VHPYNKRGSPGISGRADWRPGRADLDLSATERQSMADLFAGQSGKPEITRFVGKENPRQMLDWRPASAQGSRAEVVELGWRHLVASGSDRGSATDRATF